ncbi:MAG: hypothetical protein KDB27_25390 [Planctomycetales bacterium]|nr:hypothetical protein [Planctomycetales bacterium]
MQKSYNLCRFFMQNGVLIAILSMVASLIVAGTAHAVPMFIIAGQSNAAGQAYSRDLPEDASPAPNLLYYRL